MIRQSGILLGPLLYLMAQSMLLASAATGHAGYLIMIMALPLLLLSYFYLYQISHRAAPMLAIAGMLPLTWSLLAHYAGIVLRLALTPVVKDVDTLFAYDTALTYSTHLYVWLGTVAPQLLLIPAFMLLGFAYYRLQEDWLVPLLLVVGGLSMVLAEWQPQRHVAILLGASAQLVAFYMISRRPGRREV